MNKPTLRGSLDWQSFRAAASTSGCSVAPSRPSTPSSVLVVPIYHRFHSSHDAVQHSHLQPNLHSANRVQTTAIAPTCGTLSCLKVKLSPLRLLIEPTTSPQNTMEKLKSRWGLSFIVLISYLGDQKCVLSFLWVLGRCTRNALLACTPDHVRASTVYFFVLLWDLRIQESLSCKWYNDYDIHHTLSIH
jgi:hypothetical protein